MSGIGGQMCLSLTLGQIGSSKYLPSDRFTLQGKVDGQRKRSKNCNIKGFWLENTPDLITLLGSLGTGQRQRSDTAPEHGSAQVATGPRIQQPARSFCDEITQLATQEWHQPWPVDAPQSETVNTDVLIASCRLTCYIRCIINGSLEPCLFAHDFTAARTGWRCSELFPSIVIDLEFEGCIAVRRRNNGCGSRPGAIGPCIVQGGFIIGRFFDVHRRF